MSISKQFAIHDKHGRYVPNALIMCPSKLEGIKVGIFIDGDISKDDAMFVYYPVVSFNCDVYYLDFPVMEEDYPDDENVDLSSRCMYDDVRDVIESFIYDTDGFIKWVGLDKLERKVRIELQEEKFKLHYSEHNDSFYTDGFNKIIFHSVDQNKKEHDYSFTLMKASTFDFRYPDSDEDVLIAFGLSADYTSFTVGVSSISNYYESMNFHSR